MPDTHETPPSPGCVDSEPSHKESKPFTDSSKRAKLDGNPTASNSLSTDSFDNFEDLEVEKPLGLVPENSGTTSTGLGPSPPLASGSQCATSVDDRAMEESKHGTASNALRLVFSWKDDNLDLQIDRNETIGDLKVVVYSLTAVPPERQKILGLVPGKLPLDDVLLSTIDLKMKRGVHFKLLGSPEEDTILRGQGGCAPTVSDSTPLQGSYSTSDCVLYFPQIQAKMDEISAKLELNIMNPLRPGKKLLVLDLDYTLMDSKAYSDYSVHALDMTRPYLHEFLTALWPYYDICIWSATSWRWLESKLVELGMVGGNYVDKYLIQFVLDRGTMFEVTSIRHGKVARHEVKALDLIWRKLDTYNATNTLHLDDLSRNFVLNPTSGVKISPFKYAKENKHDRQLVFLTRYFLQMALQPDVRLFDHRHWADCTLPLPPGVKDPLQDLDPEDPELVKFLRRHRTNHGKTDHK